MIPTFSMAISVALASMSRRFASSTVASASSISVSIAGSEWRPRLEAPKPRSLS